jgi:hypothetical protein
MYLVKTVDVHSSVGQMTVTVKIKLSLCVP